VNNPATAVVKNFLSEGDSLMTNIEIKKDHHAEESFIPMFIWTDWRRTEAGANAAQTDTLNRATKVLIFQKTDKLRISSKCL